MTLLFPRTPQLITFPDGRAFRAVPFGQGGAILDERGNVARHTNSREEWCKWLTTADANGELVHAVNSGDPLETGNTSEILPLRFE